MPDILIDGKVRVAYLATLINKSAPTVAELNAGLQLQTIMTPDGLVGFEADTAVVDNTSLASTFDTNIIGRDSFANTMLRIKKQTGTDTAYTTLVRDALGFIVVRRYIAQTTAWTAGQKVSVFPVVCGTKKELSPEKNSLARYEVPTVITDEPDLNATVAA